MKTNPIITRGRWIPLAMVVTILWMARPTLAGPDHREDSKDTVWIRNGIMYSYNPSPNDPTVWSTTNADTVRLKNPVPSTFEEVVKDPSYRRMVDSLFTSGTPFNRDSVAGIILSKDPLFTADWDIHEVHYTLCDFATLPGHLKFDLLRGNERFRYNWYGSLTWGYGPRWGRMHKGLDTYLEHGDSLFATFNGIVRYAEYNKGGYGNCVVIRHFNGIETLYAHMSKLNVKPGDLLQTGDFIGRAGATGRADGPHLHFETRYRSYPFDPLLMLNKFECLELIDTVMVLEKNQLLNDGSTGKGTAVNYVKDRFPQAKYHTVRKGETLSTIAKKHKVTVDQLVRLNKLKNKNQLKAGQKLRVR
jgi:murein DD-endopeptidase MepM/ murein hydrolase activator NlpD